MKELVERVMEFNAATRRDPERVRQFEVLARGQHPDTLFIGCADSRVVPHLLSSAEPGDLFVHRNVGNLVPPADVSGRSVGDRSEAAMIEYAVAVLGVRDLVVCGHSNCGAMKALLVGVPPGAPNLDEWLSLARGALDDDAFSPRLGEGRAREDLLSQRNVLCQLANVATYPLVRRAIEEGSLALHGWWFDIGEAEVLVWDAGAARFASLDHAAAR